MGGRTLANDQQPDPLRSIDDDTLLQMYDVARTAGQVQRCELISDELEWRGIVAPPCGDQAS
jgi:hypothetical protein